jgi:hypothetical protein
MISIYCGVSGAIESIWCEGLVCVQRNMPHACGGVAAYSGAFAMLDVIFIVIGAAFLGGCVLYALACDHL